MVYSMSASVKTAISMQQNLFNEVNELASELKVSRSKLFVLAIEDYIKKNESKKMLSQINAAFSDFPNSEEECNTSMMKRKQKSILESDTW